MQEEMKLFKGGGMSPAKQAAATIGLPRVTPTVPTIGASPTALIPARAPIAKPTLNFGSTFGDEATSENFGKGTKESALQALGVTVDKEGKIQVIPRPVRTAFGKSALFGTEQYTPEELVRIRQLVEKIIANPQIPWGSK